MKIFLLLVLLGGIGFAGSGCFVRPRNDIHTHVFSVPKAGSQDCVKVILDILGSAAGVQHVEPDPANATLTVTFDTRVTALKNIEYALAEAGFDVDASVGRAAAKAALPENCR